jgi:hypothetical protein
VLSSFAQFAVISMADAAKAVSTIYGWTLAPGTEEAVMDIERIVIWSKG